MVLSRKSTYGYVLILNGGPVAWGSTLGKTVATSTCEAEISAAVIACREAVHFKGMLVEFGVMSADSPLQIAEDNSAAIAQAQIKSQKVCLYYFLSSLCLFLSVFFFFYFRANIFSMYFLFFYVG